MSEEKRRYRVTLCGCDDSTPMELELSEAEAALVQRLCDASDNASEYGCMPTMVIEPLEVPHA